MPAPVRSRSTAISSPRSRPSGLAALSRPPRRTQRASRSRAACWPAPPAGRRSRRRRADAAAPHAAGHRRRRPRHAVEHGPLPRLWPAGYAVLPGCRTPVGAARDAPFGELSPRSRRACVPSRATATAGTSSRRSTSSSAAIRMPPTPMRTPRDQGRDRRAAGRLRRCHGARRRRHRQRGRPPRLPEDPQARAGPPRGALLAGAGARAGRPARRGACRIQGDAGGRARPTRPGAPRVEQHIAEVSRRLAERGADGTPRGPTAEDVAAAQQLTRGPRAQMIAQHGRGPRPTPRARRQDLAGWVRLVNAYAVLGREQRCAHRARQCAQAARRRRQGDGRVAALAQRLGLGS